jgi:excisionase family DNA binding protein
VSAASESEQGGLAAKRIHPGKAPGQAKSAILQMVRKFDEKLPFDPSPQSLESNLLANRMLTAQELAAYLRVNRSTVYRLLKKGELPGFRIGSEWRFRIDEVNRWFRERHPGGQ